MEPTPTTEEIEEPAAPGESTAYEVPKAWYFRKLLPIFAIPTVVILVAAAWAIIPSRLAKVEQGELAKEFFEECRQEFRDTSQIPKVPEEALQEAERKRNVTETALQTWLPVVSGQIQDGYWYAKIQFKNPEPISLTERIGVAVNDVSDNPDSERQR